MGEAAVLTKPPGCRAERSTPAQHNGVLLLTFAAFIIGYVATDRFIGTRRVAKEFDPVSAEFSLWTAVLGMVGGFGLAMLVYCGAALLGVCRLFEELRRRTVVAALLATLVALGTVFIGLLAASANAPDSVEKRLTEANRPVVICVGLCVVPGLMGLLLLRTLARQQREWSDSGLCQLALVRRLRSEMRRFLGTLGAFLTLLVIATGLRRQAILALAPETHLPAVSVVLYGFIFAVLLGGFYAVASAAVDARAAALVESYAALPAPDAVDLVEAVGRRTALNSLVGLGEGTWRTFQSGVVIAAPLFTALLSNSVG